MTQWPHRCYQTRSVLTARRWWQNLFPFLKKKILRNKLGVGCAQHRGARTVLAWHCQFESVCKAIRAALWLQDPRGLSVPP